MELPFDCGCENRREVMGAGEWHDDAMAVGVVVLILVVVFVVTRK